MLSYLLSQLLDNWRERCFRHIAMGSDRKSLLCPEFGIYVRVVGMLQIEQSELWCVHRGYPYSHTLWRGG